MPRGRYGRLTAASWRSVLQSIAILLLTTGASHIQNGDYILGGAMATAGFLLLVIANYAMGG